MSCFPAVPRSNITQYGPISMKLCIQIRWRKYPRLTQLMASWSDAVNVKIRWDMNLSPTEKKPHRASEFWVALWSLFVAKGKTVLKLHEKSLSFNWFQQFYKAINSRSNFNSDEKKYQQYLDSSKDNLAIIPNHSRIMKLPDQIVRIKQNPEVDNFPLLCRRVLKVDIF